MGSSYHEKYILDMNVIRSYMISAGLLITDGNRFLAELPLHQTPGEHHYDLPKGHVEEFDMDMKDTAFREAYEETGYNFDIYKDRAYPLSLNPIDYIKGKQIMLYRLDLKAEEMPDINYYKCNSYFKDKKTGRDVPEVIDYEYKPLSEIRLWLFNGYSRSFDAINIF